MELERVQGEDAGDVVLFALSTCVWCGKTRKLLDSLGVAYSYVYVDRLQDGSRREALNELRKHNPEGGFPTVVIGGERVIKGHSPRELREALGVEE